MTLLPYRPLITSVGFLNKGASPDENLGSRPALAQLRSVQHLLVALGRVQEQVRMLEHQVIQRIAIFAEVVWFKAKINLVFRCEESLLIIKTKYLFMTTEVYLPDSIL